ncbi:phosphoesterase [Rhypophila decipiens]|uniref:Phosphoesterase n=1 Tax=Rhypophila decipiens TaxID=261697 RepID=A0AAN6Y553_9PEZI|nr:phosphoesterase [Rhypophila decipiens]
MQSQPLTSIKTRGRRRRRLTAALLDLHENYLKSSSSRKQPKEAKNPIKIVCISDTHNTQPVIPPGDILIHSGDLTENGSFDEVQAGISWLSSQPHRHKFLIAGNHDVLLDDAFLEKYPTRRYGQTKTRHDLDWGTVEYLQDAWTTIEIPVLRNEDDRPCSASPLNQTSTRKITIFGSPRTPKYGVSAFQYTDEEGERNWSSKEETVILITHGPPNLYLDKRDFHRAGCPYLLDAIYKLRPRLHVFGHIHNAYGVQEDVVLDRVRQAHDDVMIGWGGIRTIVLMLFFGIWERLRGHISFGKKRDRGRVTTFVNASIVAGMDNHLQNEPIVVEI